MRRPSSLREVRGQSGNLSLHERFEHAVIPMLTGLIVLVAAA
jgi:hypothetical protein